MKYIHFLLILFLSLTGLNSVSGQEKGKVIHLSGSNVLTGEWMDGSYPNSTIPPWLLRDELSLRLSLWGMPFYGGILLSTEDNAAHQSINQYFFRMGVDEWLNGRRSDLLRSNSWFSRRVLSRIYKLEVGNIYPNYSSFLFGGVPVRGINAAFLPGPFFMAFCYGNLNSSIQNPSPFVSPFPRKMLFGSFGAGHPERSHVFVNVMHIKDQNSVYPVDTTIYARPADTLVIGMDTIIHPGTEIRVAPSMQENFVAGTDLLLSMLKKRLYLGGEMSVSYLTPDLSGEILEVNGIPQWFTDYFQPRLGTHVDYSYLIKTGLTLKTTSVKGTYQYVGPGYVSLANPYLRTNQTEIKILLQQTLLKRKASVNVTLIQRDEIDRGSYRSAGITVSLRWPKLPTFMMGVFPSELISETYRYSSQLYQISVSHPWKLKSNRMQTTLSLINQTGNYVISEQTSTTGYWSVALNQMLSAGSFITASLVSGMSNRNTGTIQKRYWTNGGTLSFRILENLNAGLGSTYIFSNQSEQSLRLNLSGNMDIKKVGDIRLFIQYQTAIVETFPGLMVPPWMVQLTFSRSF